VDDKESQTYKEGLDAQINGASIDANPYLPESTLFNFWEMGWQQGADEDYEEDMNRD
jgi:ribosome modulation factor